MTTDMSVTDQESEHMHYEMLDLSFKVSMEHEFYFILNSCKLNTVSIKPSACFQFQICTSVF